MTDVRGYYDESYPPSIYAPPEPPPSAPSLVATVPSTGVNGAAISLNVTGANFDASCKVHMGATEWTTTFVDSTHLTATGTLPAAGTVQVTVVGTNGTSNARDFTVT